MLECYYGTNVKNLINLNDVRVSEGQVYYESLNGRNYQLGVLFYFLNHLIGVLEFECTSFFSLQSSLTYD